MTDADKTARNAEALVERDSREALIDLLISDARYDEEQMISGLHGQNTLALGVLTAALAVGALLASALKDLTLPPVSVVLAALAAVMLLASAVMALVARIMSYLTVRVPLTGRTLSQEIALNAISLMGERREELRQLAIDPDPLYRDMPVKSGRCRGHSTMELGRASYQEQRAGAAKYAPEPRCDSCDVGPS